MAKFINENLGVKLETDNELVIEQFRKNPEYIEILEETIDTITEDSKNIDTSEVEETTEVEETKKSTKKK